MGQAVKLCGPFRAAWARLPRQDRDRYQRSVQRLEENVRAATQPLPPEIVARLNATTQPVLDKLGNSFDYYESPENDRTR